MCIGGRNTPRPALQQRTTPDVKAAPADESAKAATSGQPETATTQQQERPKLRKEEEVHVPRTGVGTIDTSDQINY